MLLDFGDVSLDDVYFVGEVVQLDASCREVCGGFLIFNACDFFCGALSGKQKGNDSVSCSEVYNVIVPSDDGRGKMREKDGIHSEHKSILVLDNFVAVQVKSVDLFVRFCVQVHRRGALVF